MNFRLNINPAFEAGTNWIENEYETRAELEAAKDIAANLLLFLQETIKVMKDYSNVFICQEKIDGEWMDIEEE